VKTESRIVVAGVAFFSLWAVSVCRASDRPGPAGAPATQVEAGPGSVAAVAAEPNEVHADVRSFGPFGFELQVLTDIPPGVHGMAVSPDGTLYFSDSFANYGAEPQVYTLAPPYTGAPVPTGIFGATVSGLKWEGDNLYVCVTGESRVRRYNSDHVLQQTWVVSTPWNIERIGDELLVVTYDGQVRALGATAAIVSGLEYPFDLAPASEDTFWVSEQVGAGVPGRIRQFDKRGTEIGSIEYDWSNPEGLAVDNLGWLYVADTDAGEVLRASPEGDVELLSDAFPIPVVMTRHPSGDIFFSTSGAQARVVRIAFAPIPIPCATAYGVAIMACALLIAGAILFGRRPEGAVPERAAARSAFLRAERSA
jgi:sugar lactone lactonase YvrE